MRASAREQIGALDVFRRATTTLGAVLEGLDIPIQPERSAMVDIKSAILNLCVIGVRSARAAGVLIRSGYEGEALGLVRRVHEAYARVGAVIDDESGQHAREWLEGRGGKPRKVAGKFGNLAFFDMYSEATHASMAGLLQWIAVYLDDGRRMMPIAPMRDPATANTMLVGLSIECRDLAKIAGVTFEREVRGIEHLDADLLYAIEQFVGAKAVAERDTDEPERNEL